MLSHARNIPIEKHLRRSIFQIQFLDHIILGSPQEGHAGYFSFKEAGMI
jgi:hypothetical protein